jgi:two-component system, response regulator
MDMIVRDPQGPVTILLADDDEEDRDLVRDASEDARLMNAMRFVADGQQLMDYLRRDGAYADPAIDAPRPGIILLDLNMPRKDGRGARRDQGGRGPPADTGGGADDVQ